MSRHPVRAAVLWKPLGVAAVAAGCHLPPSRQARQAGPAVVTLLAAVVRQERHRRQARQARQSKALLAVVVAGPGARTTARDMPVEPVRLQAAAVVVAGPTGGLNPLATAVLVASESVECG